MKTKAVSAIILSALLFLSGCASINESRMIDDKSFRKAQSEYVLDNLDGDADEEYLIMVYMVGNSQSDNEISIRPNNDVNANYGYQTFFSRGGITYAARSTTTDLIAVNDSPKGRNIGMAVGRLYARRGFPRIWQVVSVRGINGTYVGRVGRYDGVWNNANDNITSLVFMTGDTGTGSFGAGTRIMTLANKEGTGMRLAERYEVTAGPVDSYTFRNLRGNRDKFYIVRTRIVNGNSDNPVYVIRPNGATSGYGYQQLEGAGSAVGASRGTDITGFYAGQNAGQGHITMGEVFIYAKAGYARTAISKSLYGVSGTDIAGLNLFGGVWDNTDDEVTSLTVTSYNHPTNCLGVGTILELWES